MIELNPMMIEEVRFLSIQMHLPKCTMRILFNMKLICFDDCFDIKTIEKRCPIPMVSVAKSNVEQMLKQQCTVVSASASQAGITTSMTLKEAIVCACLQES